jgi:uncharacterized protein (DUF4213/DUF364 family)
LALKPVLDEAREKLQTILARHHLSNEIVQVALGPLSVKQAIGSPSRQDFALLEGKETMIEAQFKGSYGQAFTDQPQSFNGLLKDVLSLGLNTNNERAIFVATLNAVTAYLGIVAGVRHCRDEEPEKCGSQIAQYILTKFGRVKVGLVGLQPAILENLVGSLGVYNVRCNDLNPKNIGSHKFGVEIWDGKTDAKRLADWCELLLVTSSAIVNNTFDAIREEAISRGRPLIIFGVTGAGVSVLLGLKRACFFAH